MVKRQTVWLSTMMVLSLMLIGYYSMNNGVQTTSKSGSGSTIVTGATTPPSSSTSTSPSTASASSPSQGSSTGSSTTGSASSTTTTGTSTSTSTSTASSASDWFVKLQTQVTNDLSRQEDVYSQVLSSTNATATQMSQAEEQLKQLEALIGEIGNAQDAVVGDGFKAAVIVPDLKTNTATVYVKSTSLSASEAVKVMNIVSQNMNIPINNVVVNYHA